MTPKGSGTNGQELGNLSRGPSSFLMRGVILQLVRGFQELQLLLGCRVKVSGTLTLEMHAVPEHIGSKYIKPSASSRQAMCSGTCLFCHDSAWTSRLQGIQGFRFWGSPTLGPMIKHWNEQLTLKPCMV